MTETAIETLKPKPLLILESRPSAIDGISFWLVLSYKDFNADEILPRDFMAIEDTERNLIIARAAEKLRLLLKPILEAEDSGV